MTFSCRNYDVAADRCIKLKVECIPGRPGCVLEGKATFSEEINKKLEELKQATAKKKRSRRSVV